MCHNRSEVNQLCYTPHMLIAIFYAEGNRHLLLIGISKGLPCFICIRTLLYWPFPNPFHLEPKLMYCTVLIIVTGALSIQV